MANVLVVDDDPDVADALAEVLSCEGHEVRVAHDGLEALGALEQRLADVVLLDVVMPRLDGAATVYEMLLRNAGLEEIPVILVSGNLDLTRIAEDLGTPYYLRKPYPLDAALEVLERAIAERSPPRPKALRAARRWPA